MKPLTVDEVLKFEANALSQGAAFISVVAVTPLRHNQTHRETGERFPFSNPRKMWWGVYSTGAEYERRVVNRLARELGISTEEAGRRFSAEKPSGKHRVVNPYTGLQSRLVLESDREPGKYYLRLYGTDNPNHRTNSRVLDGNNIEITVDPGYLPVRSPARKQHVSGMQQEVSVRDVTLENIRSIKCGENEFVGIQ